MQFDHHGPRFFFLFVFLHFGLQPLVVLQRLFPTFHCHVKAGEDTTVPEKHQHTENQVTEHNMHVHRVNACNERKKDPRHTYQTFLFFFPLREREVTKNTETTFPSPCNL